MQERQLIKKIKELRQIKPNQNWVLFTKKEILGQEKETQVLSWLFTPFSRPALVVRPLIAGVLILAGVFVYLYWGALAPQLVQLPFASEKEGVKTETMVASLTEIQASLAEITLALNNLRKTGDPFQVLGVTEVVKVTAKKGEEIVGQIKTESKFQLQVLASFQELGEVADDTQVEVLEALIEDLKQTSLSEEDQIRLANAQQYYNEGKYNEAMILIMRIGNN